MRNLILISLLLSLFLINTSCEDITNTAEIAHDNLLQGITLLDALSTDSNVGILVTDKHANFSLESQSFVHVAAAVESGINGSDQISLNGETFRIEVNGQKTQLENGSNNFFGRDVLISIPSSNNSRQNGTIVGPYYFPQSINLTNPTAANPNNPLAPIIREGSLIEWNEDPLNKNGVFIVLDYTAFDNPQHGENTGRYVDYVQVDDNGSYTFKAIDFPRIPQNSLVIMKVIRGVFDFNETKVANDIYENIRVVSFTQTAGFIRYQ